MGLLPSLNGQSKKRDQSVAIDLGGRTTKAVHLQRRGDRFSLLDFALLDAPISEKGMSAARLGDHLKAVTRELGAGRPKSLTVALGVNDSVLRQAELPIMPLSDLRQILRFNPKAYLQQDLSDHVFDCEYVLRRTTPTAEAAKPAAGPPKQKALVGGVRQSLLADLQSAVKTAGFIPEQVVPGLVGPVNAFELAEPELFKKEVVALVDLGFKNTTITILDGGEIKLNRIVAIGGDRLTSGLAEALNLSYAEAEGLKMRQAEEAQPCLEMLVHPLGRELRASVDFFEHQEDKAISQAFVSGGAARDESIRRWLQNELMVPCQSWNPTRSLHLALAPSRLAQLEQAAPQLTVAIGAAIAGF